MQFVDKENCGGFALTGSRSEGLQERGQVLVKIAVIGKARLRLEIQTDFNVSVLNLQGLDETRKCLESFFREFASLIGLVELQFEAEGLAARQRSILGRLNPKRMNARVLRGLSDVIEKDRLADTPKSNK